MLEVLGNPALAMGAKPKEPEYKLEILKMEMVPATSTYELKAAPSQETARQSCPLKK